MHTAPPQLQTLRTPSCLAKSLSHFISWHFRYRMKERANMGDKMLPGHTWQRFELCLAKRVPHKHSSFYHSHRWGYWKEALTSLLFRGWHGRQLSTMRHTGSFSALKQRPRSLHICGKRHNHPQMHTHCNRTIWITHHHPKPQGSTKPFTNTRSRETSTHGSSMGAILKIK